MDDTVLNNIHPRSEINLQLELQQMEAQYLDLKMKFDMLQKENAHLRKENNQLKRMPLFVAVVVDMLGNGEIYLRQQGNNQEYLTHVDEEPVPHDQARHEGRGQQLPLRRPCRRQHLRLAGQGHGDSTRRPTSPSSRWAGSWRRSRRSARPSSTR